MTRGGKYRMRLWVTSAAGLVLIAAASGCGAGASGPITAPITTPVTSPTSSPSPSPTPSPSVTNQPTPDSSEAVLKPRGPTISGTVVRVVDGDTVRVLVDGQREDISVRLIGIDTPETVAPGRPVECFGPEASDFAKQVLDQERVLLEFDPTQGETDRFNRTLAYVWVVSPSGTTTLFNLAAITGGFAREAQYGSRYAWQPEFLAAQDQAQANGIGRWSACPG